MEKVKSVFSTCVAWIKAHLKIVIAVVAVLVVAIIVVNLIGGSEKSAINKYLSALNDCDEAKVIKAMDLKGAVAWSNTTTYDNDNAAEDFKDNYDKVESDDTDTLKKKIEDSVDKDDKGKVKYKLLKIVSTAKAKDDNNLKRVVARIQMTVKPDKDDEDKDDDKSMWKKQKKYTTETVGYATFILYKNKVISTDIGY